MATRTLSSDQRHLLRLIDTMSLFDALLSKDGADRLMSRQCGGTGFSAPEGAPLWMTSYDTDHRVLISPAPWKGPPQAKVSAAQIVGFGADLPGPVRDQMHDCLRENRAEMLRVYGWCRCPHADRPPNAHTGPCTRYHPTDAEDSTHYAILGAVTHRAQALLADILAVGGGQLALFA
jgi:hypothetical protein